MIAYLIHNGESQTDTFYLPEGECYLTADRVRMEAFISVDPDYANWPRSG